MKGTSVPILAALAFLLLTLSTPAQTTRPETLHFDFGPGPAVTGHVRLPDLALYTRQLGYGFEAGARLQFAAGGVSSSQPFFFHAAVPEGNYRVTVTLGDPTHPAETYVYAELRRLMLERIATDAGQLVTRSFIVNVRTPAIAGGGQVRINARERTQETWAWDDRLSLEFNGAHPALAALQIEHVDVPTLYLLGDSTVCDQPAEPYNSWGQMLPRFLKPTVAVANHSESGESVAGALAAGRFDKIWAQMKPGDCLFVQFGHNDMKSTAVNALETYTNNLRRVVDETRRRGGMPVLLTPVSRRTFDARGKITNSFGGYPDAVKLVVKEKDVPCIDLQEMGAAFYESLGPDVSHQAFATAAENTHHGDYGSYQIAKCVVQRLRTIKLPLAVQIADDFREYDPAHPDKFEDLRLPANLKVTNMAPPGDRP